MSEAGEKTTRDDRRDDSSRDPSPQKELHSEIDGPTGRRRNRETPGILRSESASRSPRYNIANPFLTPQVQVPSSPQPSVDRLSVTFAIADEEPCFGDSQEVVFRDQKSQLQFVIAPVNYRGIDKDVGMRRIPAVAAMADGEEPADEDDYSASASAIIQRRASLRRPSRRKRRSSSPFNPDGEGGNRRRSSAFTTSSGDTAISVEEGGTQEQIFENLKLHKEVLSGVKQQPWPLRRKMKLVQQAKSYVRRHEGALQERLAQNRSTRDVIARASILLNKNWQYFRRELVNLQTWLIPWELRIKEIESHFGSAVASYFIFLRWIFWINLVIATILAVFVAVPEMLTADQSLGGVRKTMLPEEKAKSMNLLTLWEFDGALKYSPFFYGWYTNQDTKSGYRLPLAYFLSNLVVYVYSFVAILRKMAENSRMSKLSEKEDECAFTWKLFTGWDFMIGNPETAHNRVASIVLGFKEALLEEAEKQKVPRNWKTLITRTFVNLAILSLFALSAFAVVQVVSRSDDADSESNWWRQNEITIVMSLIGYIFPIFFELLGIFENYHPRKQLRFQLARIMVLNLLNLYSLIFALFGKISKMTKDLNRLKPNVTGNTNLRDCTVVRTEREFCQNLSLTIVGAIALANITSQNVTVGSSPNAPNSLMKTGPTFQVLNSTIPAITGTKGSTTTKKYYEEGSGPYDDYDYTAYDDVTPGIGEEDSVTFSTTRFDESTATSATITYETTSETYNLTESSTSYSTSTDRSTTEDGNYFTLTSKATSLESTTRYESTTDSSTDGHMTVGGPPTPKREENVRVECYLRTCDRIPHSENRRRNGTFFHNVTLELKTQRELKRLCWETMFGQELAKLTFADLAMTILSTIGMDFFRALFVRHMNNCWCWDLEKQFPQYGDFKIAESILHLVNNQGMVWMGMFFSPGLPTLNVIKIIILMYLRSWAVLTCNVPHEIVFRASRSNNFYLALLLTMLFLCVLPVGYAIVWVEPSWHCGPFSEYYRMYRIATESLQNALPQSFHRILDYIASPGSIIPLIVLMALIIYYMVSLTGSLREANNDLKIQLRQERTEERRKMFQIAEKRHDIQDTPFVRWKKILPVLPSSKSAMVVIEQGTAENITLQRKELRKQSAASEAGEATDGEQDSLPHDPGMINSKEIVVDIVPRNKRLIKQFKNRSYSSSSVREGDSLGSQNSDFGIIPKIRISGTEGSGEIYGPRTSPGKKSVTSGGADNPPSPKTAASGSKNYADSKNGGDSKNDAESKVP